MSAGLIWRETLRGKSLGRTLQNMEYAKLTLRGRGIDLGAKSDASSYYRFLARDEAEVVFTDLVPRPGVIRVDLEKQIPVGDSSQDFLILGNVLEHVYDYRACLAECARVLKPGGRLIGSTPFLVQFHPDPDDYFRYTDSALSRMFAEAGFSESQITALARGPFTAAASFAAPLLKFKPLVAIGYLAALGLDRVVTTAFGARQRTVRRYFPLHYFFICTR